MQPVALSDTIAVGEFPTPEQIEILAKAGFRSLLNNQPDGEVARHLSSAAAEAEAVRHGLVYRAVPLVGRRPGEAELAAFTAALADLPKPIYACCYSGARSAAAWALASAPYAESAEIMGACDAAGFDISLLGDALATRRQTALAAARPTAEAPVAAKPANGNGAGNGNGHSNGATKPAAASEAPPALAPRVVFPRAGGDGGFTVAG